MNCNLCPRQCNVDRNVTAGYCKVNKLLVSLAMLHYGEEPCISGSEGSGTIFFAGCNLRCVYCQNSEISSDVFGKEISVKRLSEIFYELESKGANNINLVTPSHYVNEIIEALKIYRPKIPIVYNTSSYDKVEVIEKLSEYIDIFLADLKYYSSELSLKYSGAKDYFTVASSAIKKMREIVPQDEFDENGKMKKGVIIRHLVLPNLVSESVKVLSYIAENFPNTLVSIMGQYTPKYRACEFSEINRALKPLEYKMVLKCAEKLGLQGYSQDLSSSGEYIPTFDLTGV